MNAARLTGPGPVDAILLDLDGVITRTASVHARAWKDTFDAFLAEIAEKQGTPVTPFDPEVDYRAYVDGKPRYDGVRSFLRARGIRIPEGGSTDPSTAPTVHGIGRRKNERFVELVAEDGVEVFEEVPDTLRRWREQGLRLAVVSSSRNCELILRMAGLSHLFDVSVDGVDRAQLGLPGKPAPDTFVEAARRLGVDPVHSVVVEDALAGVEAGRAGGFGWVVGVARDGNADALLRHGADQVVGRLDEIEVTPRRRSIPEARPELG